MRRKGKDPYIPGQFLGSPLLENAGEEKKKKECQWHCWYTREGAESWGGSRKSLMDLEPCRPPCDCPAGARGRWPECSACCGEDKRSRQVTWKHTRASGAVQLVPQSVCPRVWVPRGRPLGRRPCSSHPCVQWLLEPGHQGMLTNLVFLIISQSL